MKLKKYKSKLAEKYSHHGTLDPIMSDSTFAYSIGSPIGVAYVSDPEDDDDVVCAPDGHLFDDYRFQLSFDLESNEDREKQLKEAIKSYQRADERIGIFARRWKDLMEAVENDPGVEQLFNDIMMLRKLNGESLH